MKGSTIKIVLISDTHGLHRQLSIPPCDLLIHAGDITNTGEESILRDFNSWLGELPVERAFFIAGNHDGILEGMGFWEAHQLVPRARYLCDSGERVIIRGRTLNLWGSPWTPVFNDWYFMRPRGESLARKWSEIPQDTDILITHGPPAGILDRDRIPMVGLGCEDLRKRVAEVCPQLHVFGHIHMGYGLLERKMLSGSQTLSRTLFVNAASLPSPFEDRDTMNDPIVVEI